MAGLEGREQMRGVVKGWGYNYRYCKGLGEVTTGVVARYMTGVLIEKVWLVVHMELMGTGVARNGRCG